MSFRHRKSSRNEQRRTLSVAGNTGKIYDLYEKLFTWTKKGGKFWYGFTYLNSSRITMLINLLSNCYQPEQLKTSHIFIISRKILHPVIIYSSLWYHSNIIQCRSNGNMSSVETLCPNILSQFHSSELDRIRHGIRAKAYRNSDKSSPNTKPIKQLRFY